jgi:hypothetical protein
MQVFLHLKSCLTKKDDGVIERVEITEISRRFAMTTTGQALSGPEATRYKQILDKVARLSKDEQEALGKEQAKIVADAIGSDAAAQNKIQTKMADLIRQRIFGNPKFDK